MTIIANKEETLKYGFKTLSNANMPNDIPSIRITLIILFSFR